MVCKRCGGKTFVADDKFGVHFSGKTVCSDFFCEINADMEREK